MTKKQLQAQLNQLQAENEALKTHLPFGILNRQGLEIERRKVERVAQFVVFGDIDDMHGLNSRHGYETVNAMIKQALQIRSDDLLLTGLWFSGDEIVFIIKGTPAGFIERVSQSFTEQGMFITLAAQPIEFNDLHAAIDGAAHSVQTAKQNRKRD